MSIQILLADDHPLVRQGLKLLLEREGFKVTAEAGNGHEAVKLAQELHPDVALIDLAMPLLNGLDAIHEIQKVSPKTKTILLTMHTESHYILQGVRAGAKGVVLKTHASEDLVRAIREASRGGTYMSPEVSRALVQAYQGKTELRPDPLSPRERQVLQLIAEGKTTKEVATFLQISVKTAETHRTRIMTKLNRRGKPSKSGRNLTIFSKYLRA
ncbi:MAG: DNA-binding response regulator, partial [Acidobacteria bacterium]